MVCAEAYIGTASRSVEILVLPPPQAVAIPAAALPPAAEGSGQVGWRSHRPRAEKDPFRTETSYVL